MSARLPPTLLLNDPDYRPFGWAWLQGVTPARMALAFGIAFVYAFSRFDIMPVARFGLSAFEPLVLLKSTTRFFAAALPLLLLVCLAASRTSGWSAPRRAWAMAGAVIVGALALALLLWPITSLERGRNLAAGSKFPTWFLNVVFQGIVWGGLGAAILHFNSRSRRAARAAQDVRLDAVRMEREIAEARLRVLHSQIEPHFLFNTLANVKLVSSTDGAAAGRLVGYLHHHLALALNRDALQQGTLAQEVALAESYLTILKVRMGERLGIRVQLPVELRDAMIPTLMVGTLVENAIKHGIGPSVSGGVVEILASRDGDQLEVRVADSGVGFREHSGAGVGLANTRARLKTMFGADGRLAIGGNPGGGVIATLRLPLRHASLETAA